MYAIIGVGTKQYTVEKDTILEVEKLDEKEGDKLTIDKVLLISKDDTVEIGTPYLKGASVAAEVLKQAKAEKTVSFKYRRRKSSHWKKGNRRKITRIRIIKISSEK